MTADDKFWRRVHGAAMTETPDQAIGRLSAALRVAEAERDAALSRVRELQDLVNTNEEQRLRDERDAARRERDALREALDLESADRRRAHDAISGLSLAVAPILAAFRGDPKNPTPETGGTFTEEQLDAAIEAMAAVQRAEAHFGANVFDKRAALRPAGEGGSET